MAETRKDAEVSFDHFIELYEAKYNKAVGCLKKDRDALLAFYDFPAEHWETFADHESDRKYVRDRPSSNHPLEGMPVG
jgi:transposase-like protein